MQEIINDIKKLSNNNLSAFARRMAQGGAFSWFMEQNDLTTEETEEVYRALVRELMRRDLVIPTGGDLDMLAIGQGLADEFGKKYEPV